MEKRGEKAPIREKFDPTALNKERDRIFNMIHESLTPKISSYESYEDANILISRVFEHSIEDGLKLSEEVNYQPGNIAHYITQPAFMLKHPEFILKVRTVIYDKYEKTSKQREIADEILAKGGSFSMRETAIEKHNPMFSLKDVVGEPIQNKLKTLEGKKILKEIDDYYAKFLEAQKIEFRKTGPEFESGSTKDKMQKADDFLEKNLAAMEGRYLSGDVENIIFTQIKRNDPEFLKKKAEKIWKDDELINKKYSKPDLYYEKLIKRNESNSETRSIVLDYLETIGLNEEIVNEVRWQSLVAPKTLEKITSVVKLGFKGDLDKFKEAKYKPLDIVYAREKQLNEKRIKELLEGWVGDYNLELVLNKEKDEYEIKEKEVSGEEEKKSDLHENMKFSAPVEMELALAQKAKNVKIIGEKVFYQEETPTSLVVHYEKTRLQSFRKDELQGIADDLVGNPIFLTKKEGQFEILFDDGTKEQLFKQYKEVSDFKVVDGRILFVGKDEHGHLFVEDFNRHDMDREGYKSMRYPTIVDGKLVVAAQDSDGNNIILREGKDPILFPKTDHPNKLTSINNKLVFYLSKEKHGAEVRTEDGKIFSEGYRYFGEPFDFNGKIAFFRTDGEKISISIEDEREISVNGSRWTDVWHDKPIVIGDEIVFKGFSAPFEFLTTNNGQKISGEFGGIESFKKVGNKIIVAGVKKGKLVKETITFKKENEEKVETKVKKISEIHESISDLLVYELINSIQIKDYTIFKAKKAGKFFVISISTPEDDVTDIKILAKDYNTLHYTEDNDSNIFIRGEKEGLGTVEESISFKEEVKPKKDKSEGFGIEKIGGKTFIEYEDGSKFGPYTDATRIDNGVIRVSFNGHDYGLVINGREYGPYDFVYEVKKIGDKIAFVAKIGEDYLVMKEGSHQLGPYSYVDRLYDIGGRVGFSAQIIEKNNEVSSNFIVENIGVVAHNYDSIDTVEYKGGTLFIKGEKNGKDSTETMHFNNLKNAEEKPETKKEINKEELEKKYNQFLLETFAGWYRAEDVKKAKIKMSSIPLDQIDYEEMGKDFDPSKFGEYTMNPETIGMDYQEKEPKVKILNEELKQFIGKPRSEVTKYVVENYGKDYYVPGMEYEEYLLANPDKIPEQLKKEGNLYYLMGSTLRDGGGGASVPSVYWSSDGRLGKSASRLGSLWLAGGLVVLFEKDQGPELTPDERSLLNLLNNIHKPDMDKIKVYFEKKNENKKDERTVTQKLRDELEKSYKFIQKMPGVIKGAPKAFLDTLPAKRDLAVDHLVKRTLFKIFPEIYEKDSSSRFGSSLSSMWSGGGEKMSEQRAEDYLENRNTNSFESGDPLEGEKGESKEVLHLRENLKEIISTGVYGKFENGLWQKFLFSLDVSISEPAKEITLTLPDVSNVQNIALPKTLNSKIIKERVKGITKDGKEIPLEVEINSLGEGVILDKKGAKQIVYSLQQNLVPEKMRDINARGYEEYGRKFERDNGVGLIEKIADLPEELEMFIDSIKDLSPKKKVFAIEKFVRGISFFDLDNAEVVSIKKGKSLEEKMMIMEERLDELKERFPELKEKLEKKKYAGVCADFGLITTTLLRRSGIFAGIVGGFNPNPNSKIVTTAESHIVSFVLFPDENGRNKIFTIDGTPGGVTAEQEKKLAELGVLAPSREEIEMDSDNQISEIKKEAEKDLEKILEIINGQDEEEIKKLSNGKLETALNNILKYSVKESHLRALKRVMESYWYTPISNLDFSESDNRVKAGGFFQNELKSVRAELEKKPEAIDKPAGAYLFESIKDFADKFVKQSKTKEIKESYDLLEKVFDLAKADLNETERKAIAAIITYLRAKKMVAGN